jgi:hypothetical protein
MGVVNCLIAVDVIPYDPAKIHAPWWAIFLAGMVFVMGGLTILFQGNKAAGAILGGVIVASFAVIGMWVAVAGPSGQFSGGVPFLSHTSNVRIARWVFAGGAVLCLLLLFAGIKQLAGPRQRP